MRGRSRLIDAEETRAGRLLQPKSQRDAARDRRGRRADADIGAPHPAVARDFAGDEIGGVGGDGEADALRAHDDGGVDADDLAGGRDERAAGVAGVQRRVGLHDVLDHAARSRLQRAPERGDDAGGHRRVEAERIADRNRDLAAPEFGAVAQPRGRQRHVGLDAQERKIGVGIVAENARLQFPAFERRQRDDARALHDMGIREREPVRRHDDAGAGAGVAASALDVDPDHAWPDALDHVADDARIVIEQGRVGEGLVAGPLGRAVRIERKGGSGRLNGG